MLVVWGGLALAAALLLRMRGVGFDAMLDRLLGVFQVVGTKGPLYGHGAL